MLLVIVVAVVVVVIVVDDDDVVVVAVVVVVVNMTCLYIFANGKGIHLGKTIDSQVLSLWHDKCHR